MFLNKYGHNVKKMLNVVECKEWLPSFHFNTFSADNNYLYDSCVMCMIKKKNTYNIIEIQNFNLNDLILYYKYNNNNK